MKPNIILGIDATISWFQLQQLALKSGEFKTQLNFTKNKCIGDLYQYIGKIFLLDLDKLVSTNTPDLNRILLQDNSKKYYYKNKNVFRRLLIYHC